MTTAETLLIVNADDLGCTQGITTGIFEAHERGLVTSATLMVGFSAAEEAARELTRYPGLGVGLHVTLTGVGIPVSPPEAVPSLVDADGRLPRRPEDLHDVDPVEVVAEIRAQLDRFHRLTGRSPTHLDSHHHSHRQPVVLDALVKVAREAGLPGAGLPVRNAAAEVGDRLRRAGVETTGAFIDSFYGEGATLENLVAILGRLGPGVTELMCHPAHLDETLRRTSTYVEERVLELAVLTSPEARRAVRERGIRLMHFGAL